MPSGFTKEQVRKARKDMLASYDRIIKTTGHGKIVIQIYKSSGVLKVDATIEKKF